MPRQSEALILRTYPFHEADLLVTFFTRTEGKIRGVAKAAKRSKRRAGAADPRDRPLGGKGKAGTGASGFLRHYFFTAGHGGHISPAGGIELRGGGDRPAYA